jgi:hypothetical protein
MGKNRNFAILSNSFVLFSGIFLAFKYDPKILTALLVARRVFLESFSSNIRFNSLSSIVGNIFLADDSPDILNFVYDSAEKQMLNAISLVVEHRKNERI